MSPFTPIGPVARWRVVYEMLQRVPVNGVLSYKEIGEALDLDPVHDRHTIQMAVRRAAKEHEEVDKRAIDSVPNVGYRVVEVPEHLLLAQRHQKRSRKQLTRAHGKVVDVDLTGVSVEVRKAFDVTATALSLLLDYNRRLDTRQKNLESAVKSSEQRHERSEQEIADLRARLERLEGSE